MNIPNTTGAYAASRTDGPRSPYPLHWSPRIYGTSFGLAGPGGSR